MKVASIVRYQFPPADDRAHVISCWGRDLEGSTPRGGALRHCKDRDLLALSVLLLNGNYLNTTILAVLISTLWAYIRRSLPALSLYSRQFARLPNSLRSSFILQLMVSTSSVPWDET